MEIKELSKKYKTVDQVTIYGWVRNRRIGKNIGFLNINDGTCFNVVQVVVHQENPAFDLLKNANIASAVKVVGQVVIPDKGNNQFEIVADKIEIIAKSDEDYPLQPKKHTYEFLRDIAHLRARSNTFNAVFRIRSIAGNAIHQFFQNQGYVWVHTPIISGTDAEGAGEGFVVATHGEKGLNNNFFGKKVELAVSGQLHGESFAMAFQKIYTFGPTFRAENSHTTRHISEFWMIEPEVAFANLNDVIIMSDQLLKYVIETVLKECEQEINFLNELNGANLINKLNKVLNSSIKIITYTDAIEILQNAEVKFDNEVKWGVDLATEHEKYLTDVYFNEIVAVTDYPKYIKAFYMYENDDCKTVAAMDVLVPGIGELIGGSQRETRLDKMTERIHEMGIDPESIGWYRDLRKYGCAPHAGFGIGFERLIMYLTDMENIRDVIPFPRTPNNAKF